MFSSHLNEFVVSQRVACDAADADAGTELNATNDQHQQQQQQQQRIT